MRTDADFPLSRPIDEWRGLVVRRGRHLRRRRRVMIASPVALGLVLLTLLVAQINPSGGGEHVHVIDQPPGATVPSPTSAPPSVTPAGPHAPRALPVTPGGEPASPANTQPAASTAPRAATPTTARTVNQAYTYVQVCSAPVGPFGRPTTPPYCWTPSTISIHSGDSVLWDGTQSFGGTVTYHTVTSSSPNWNVDASVYSNTQTGGGPGQFTYTFTKAGTYTFYCKLHGEQGRVIVTNR